MLPDKELGLLADGEVAQRTLWHEAAALVSLAGPLFVSQSSWVVMKTTDTALLGHAGGGSSRYLDAAALSDLWSSSTGVLLNGMVLGTLCGQAFGAGNMMLVGIWIQVAFAVLAVLAVMVAVAWALTGTVLRAMGEGEQIADDAQYYSVVLALSIPAQVANSLLTTFFSAQSITKPEMLTSAAATVLNAGFGLPLVLGMGVPGWTGFGFHACPLVTMAVVYVQFLLLWSIFCQKRRLHEPCWPGWSWAHVTKDRVHQFVALYFPNALSIASDYWRVAAIGAVAATIGETEVGVWNASYRICWIMLTLVCSIGQAIGIRMCISLGAGRASAAKRSAFVGVALSAMLLVVVAAVVLAFPRAWGTLFSDNVHVQALFEESSVPLAAFVVLMNFAVMLEEGILVPLGRTQAVLVMGLIGSWVCQVPCVLLCTRFWRADLVGLFTGVAAGYGLLCMLYAALVASTDWEAYAQEAQSRSEVSHAKQPQSQTPPQPSTLPMHAAAAQEELTQSQLHQQTGKHFMDASGNNVVDRTLR